MGQAVHSALFEPVWRQGGCVSGKPWLKFYPREAAAVWPEGKCTACDGQASRNTFVYVVERADQPWTKCGTTHSIGKRFATYRKEGISPTLRHSWLFCCSTAAEIVEAEAHHRLHRSAVRKSGDWFSASAEDSEAAVLAALKSRKVRDYL